MKTMCCRYKITSQMCISRPRPRQRQSGRFAAGRSRASVARRRLTLFPLADDQYGGERGGGAGIKHHSTSFASDVLLQTEHPFPANRSANRVRNPRGQAWGPAAFVHSGAPPFPFPFLYPKIIFSNPLLTSQEMHGCACNIQE